MSVDEAHCVVVGAGHAAAQLCGSLRQLDWPGRITLIGDEPVLPYHRPPLSKSQLDPRSPEPIQLIRPEAFYRDGEIETITGQRVVALDRISRRVMLESDRSLGFDVLVLATGSTHQKPPIPGADHARVMTLQTAAQAEAIRVLVPNTQKVVVIGGGFIGLEAAASLRKLGVQVTVLEFADRVLSRVTSPEVSSYFAKLHRGNGVELQTSTAATAICERDGQLEVATQSGDEISADFVLVGVGALPNVQLAEASGLEVDNGVLVNAFNQTSDPKIYAIGDCCRQHHPLYGTHLRLESVQNASDQAKTAALSIAGSPKPHEAVPWFWSDQYDTKFQIAGVSNGYDRNVTRGTPEPGQSFSIWYFKSDKLIAVDAINDPSSYAVAGRVIPAGKSPDSALIADVAVSPKEILQSAR